MVGVVVVVMKVRELGGICSQENCQAKSVVPRRGKAGNGVLV